MTNYDLDSKRLLTIRRLNKRIAEREAETKQWQDVANGLTDVILRRDHRIAELEDLVKSAFNEGFGEGMREGRRHGGLTWHDSKSRKKLEKTDGEECCHYSAKELKV